MLRLRFHTAQGEEESLSGVQVRIAQCLRTYFASLKGGRLGLAGQTRFNRDRIYSIRFACACEWDNPDSKCHVKGGTVSYGIYVTLRMYCI